MFYGYARVSTAGQAAKGNSLEDQLELLKNAGCSESNIFLYRDKNGTPGV